MIVNAEITRVSYVYALSDPTTGAVRYVGQTRVSPKHRRSQHLQRARARSTSSSHVLAWLRSLIRDGKQPDVSVLASGLWSTDELNQQEIYWIARGRELGWQLTNHAVGGDFTEHTAETRKRISDSLNRSETRAKLSRASKGRVLSPETREKLRQAHTGKAVSTAARANMSAAQRARWEIISDKERNKIIGSMAAANRGAKHSEAARKKMSDARKGAPSPMRGRTMSEETKVKMREAHRLRWERIRAEGRYDEVVANISAGTRQAMARTKETP